MTKNLNIGQPVIHNDKAVYVAERSPDGKQVRIVVDQRLRTLGTAGVWVDREEVKETE